MTAPNLSTLRARAVTGLAPWDALPLIDEADALRQQLADAKAALRREQRRNAPAQRMLFRRAPHCGRDTSIAAADSLTQALPALQRAVLTFVRAQGETGATDYEIEQGLSLAHQTASARRNELEDGGFVRDSGKRRRTGSNRMAIVWVAL